MINKQGLKIKNIQAGSLYGYNLGIRERYDYIGGILSDSLFSRFLINNGMSVWRGESTRDIICIDFSYGSRSYEEEVAHIESMIRSAKGADEKERLVNLLAKCHADKDKYCKRSKDELREMFYENGVDVKYFRKNSPEVDIIHYKMLYRNTSKAKLGQVMFINEKLYDVAYEWMTMGIGKRLPDEGAKIVEISAYAPLTTSTIVGDVPIPVEDILILDDQDSSFNSLANIVEAEEYPVKEKVIDEEATARAKQRALENGIVDHEGNPIYKRKYKQITTTRKKCIVNRRETEITNTLWDGMALIESSILPNWINGMCLLRNHFFKACAFRTNIKDFFRDWCAKTGNDYNTFTVNDMFGKPHRLCDIKMITTHNAIKWLKFKNLMGDDPHGYWCNRINEDGSIFGVVKTDHPSKLGSEQQMSYQMINTLPTSNLDIAELAKGSIEYVEKLKTDSKAFVEFLRANANEINCNEMMADLYDHNPDFAESKWFRSERSSIIYKYVNRLRSGKITVNGDNLTLCGNPYALLLYSVGEDWHSDPTLGPNDECIECYTSRFPEGSYLCAMRSPHNSPNGVCYFKNVYSDEMKRYFEFSDNIIAVNCIETDIQSRLNGCDFDSDFVFVTDHPVLVKAAKRCIREYPTIVNALKESSITYDNRAAEYARMDNKFAKSKRGIGESSNLAQFALSYYWTERAMFKPDTEAILELYDNFIILSVLAQVVIDGCKREYEVDAISEIERIKKMPCMTPIYGGHKADYPFFMKYVKDVNLVRGGKFVPYAEVKRQRDAINNRINYQLVCPMNTLQYSLSGIKGSPKTSTIPTDEFIVKVSGNASTKKVTKIIKLAERFDAFLKTAMSRNDEQGINEEMTLKHQDFLKEVEAINVKGLATMNKLIRIGLRVDNDFDNLGGVRCFTRILNTLYRVDKEKFLSNFADESVKIKKKHSKFEFAKLRFIGKTREKLV